MTEPSYEQREILAKKMSLTAELTVLAFCRHLGINPRNITGSPLLVIADRQAQRASERGKAHG
jgi:hypothetical protein